MNRIRKLLTVWRLNHVKPIALDRTCLNKRTRQGIPSSFLFLATIVICSLFTTSCLGGCDIAKAQSKNNNTIPIVSSEITSQFNDDKFLAFSGSRISLFDALNGSAVWEYDCGETIYPYLLRNTANIGNSLLTWINEYGTPNLALLNQDRKLLYSAAGGVISVEYGDLAVVEVLAKSGAEGINVYSTEVVDLSTGKVIRSYDLVSSQVQTQAAHTSYALTESNSTGYLQNSRILLSGPADESSIDTYGCTDCEKIVRYDLETRKELFSVKLEKEYGSPFELVLEKDDYSILHYSIQQTDERLLCLNEKGKVQWINPIDGQLVHSAVYPFQGFLSKSVAAVDRSNSTLAIYLVHEMKPPTCSVIDISTGKTINEFAVDTDGRYATSICFTDGGILLNMQHGASAYKLDTGNGILTEANPTEKKPELAQTAWKPFQWKAPSSETTVDISANSISMTSGKNNKQIKVRFPSPNRPEVVGLFGQPSRYLVLAFPDSFLSQNIAPIECRLVVDLSENRILLGDIFDHNSRLYYGINDIVIFGSTINQINIQGNMSTLAEVEKNEK